MQGVRRRSGRGGRPAKPKTPLPLARTVRLLLAIVPLLLAGCFQDAFRDPASTLGFACAVLNPALGGEVHIEGWSEPGLPDLRPLLAKLGRELANATGRADAGFRVTLVDEPARPAAGWNRSALEFWGARPYLAQGVATLHAGFVGSFGERDATGFVAAPGSVVVAWEGVRAAADRLGRSHEEAAFAVLLHHIGHALGEVNAGIPVQQSDIQDQEAPPGHDKDPASVLHAGWDDARTIVWANGTYDRYPATSVRDWTAARAPGGVCT